MARDGAPVRRDPAGPLPAGVDAREPRGQTERPPRLRPDDPVDPEARPALEAADGEARRAAEPPVGPVDPEAVALQRVLDGAHPHAALALRAHALLHDERARGAGGVRRGGGREGEAERECGAGRDRYGPDAGQADRHRRLLRGERCPAGTGALMAHRCPGRGSGGRLSRAGEEQPDAAGRREHEPRAVTAQSRREEQHAGEQDDTPDARRGPAGGRGHTAGARVARRRRRMARGRDGDRCRRRRERARAGRGARRRGCPSNGTPRSSPRPVPWPCPRRWSRASPRSPARAGRTAAGRRGRRPT